MGSCCAATSTPSLFCTALLSGGRVVPFILANRYLKTFSLCSHVRSAISTWPDDCDLQYISEMLKQRENHIYNYSTMNQAYTLLSCCMLLFLYGYGYKHISNKHLYYCKPSINRPNTSQRISL